MRPLISCIKIFIPLLFLYGLVGKDSNLIKVKIELSNLTEIEKLVELGLKADGYLIGDKEWTTYLSKKHIILLSTTSFNYSIINEDLRDGLKSYVSFLFGEIRNRFNNCGYQLTVSYNQAIKLSFLSIEIYDLEGKRYGRKYGYNIPPSNYDCTFSSHNWPDGIYLIQIETNKKEKIQKVIQKNLLTKRI